MNKIVVFFFRVNHQVKHLFKLILKDHLALQKDNERLRQELNDTRKKSADQQKNLDELKQQVSILKVSSGEMNESDKKEFERRINGYIKEIDRCIALLGE